MKLDKFINRPVLSTVISVLMVILGMIGLVTSCLTQISGHCTSYRFWCVQHILEPMRKLC